MSIPGMNENVVADSPALGEIEDQEGGGTVKSTTESTSDWRPHPPKANGAHLLVWADDEGEALLKGVEDYGLDFERIIKENEDLFANRSVRALECQYRRLEPRKFKELVVLKLRKGAWTPEEDAALVKGVNDYGLDFERIRAANGALLGSRKSNSLEQRFRRSEPKKYKELKSAVPKKPRPTEWTAEQDAALAKGVDTYGINFDRIRLENSPLLSNRTTLALEERFKVIDAVKLRILRKQIPRKPRSKPWTTVEDAALVEGAAKHGLDYDRIKEDNGVLLTHRTEKHLEDRLRKIDLKKFKEYLVRTPRPLEWSSKEDAVLVKGFEEYGVDYERILAVNSEILSKRSRPVVVEKRIANLARLGIIDQDKLDALKEEVAQAQELQHFKFWPEDHDRALKNGMLAHGDDFEKILQSEGKVLGNRKAKHLKQRYSALVKKQRVNKIYDESGNEVVDNDLATKKAKTKEKNPSPKIIDQSIFSMLLPHLPHNSIHQY
ncbi:hypothetical protein TrST_g4661 [Triparma strigata]|uniref:Myb-like domain-containing protein n=1 Tax=Triparma strigata TaxID=1606541 RepID=A0A9W6ZSU5_9STRA|nr:hypothetical protein TrST_g4661 [Triparma strigata]